MPAEIDPIIGHWCQHHGKGQRSQVTALVKENGLVTRQRSIVTSKDSSHTSAMRWSWLQPKS